MFTSHTYGSVAGDLSRVMTQSSTHLLHKSTYSISDVHTEGGVLS